MGPRTRDYQQMAIAALAIATVAMGFALWDSDFDLTFPKTDNFYILWFYWVQVFGPFVAVIFYFGTLVSVIRILGRDRNVTGRHLVSQPFSWLYWQMVTLSLMLWAGFLSDLIAAQGSGKPLPM